MRELLARVRANLRRALLDGVPIPLTPIEFELLAELAQSPGQVIFPADLLRAVWGPAYVDDVGLLRTAVWRLRRKLEPNAQSPAYVVTVPRVGYTFAPGDH